MYTSSIKSFLKIILTILFLLLYFQTSIYAANVNLIWDTNTEPDLDHYVIYWGTSTENYTDNSENYGEFIGRNDTTYTATDLDISQHTYYFAAKAFDNIGQESDYSNEANTIDGPFASGDLKFCKIANKLEIKQKAIKAPKIISTPIATLITNTTTIIKWTTNEPSNSIVGYKNGYSRGCLIITHNIYTTNHIITLRNLRPNTSYIFFVGSANKNKVGPNINNIGNNPSNIYTFETRKYKAFDYEAYNICKPKAPSWGKVTPNPNTRLGKPIYTLIIPK